MSALEKPACYGECRLQQYLFDNHEALEDAIRRRLASDDPHIKLTPEGADQLRVEQAYFRETSAVAAATCQGTVTRYVLHRTLEGGTTATPAADYCEASMPGHLKPYFGNSTPLLPDNR